MCVWALKVINGKYFPITRIHFYVIFIHAILSIKAGKNNYVKKLYNFRSQTRSGIFIRALSKFAFCGISQRSVLSVQLWRNIFARAERWDFGDQKYRIDADTLCICRQPSGEEGDTCRQLADSHTQIVVPRHRRGRWGKSCETFYEKFINWKLVESFF